MYATTVRYNMCACIHAVESGTCSAAPSFVPETVGSLSFVAPNVKTMCVSSIAPPARAHSGGQERHLRIKVRARGPFPSAPLRSRTGTGSAKLSEVHACVTRSVAQVLFDPHEPREQTPFRYPIRADLSYPPALRPTAGQYCGE